MKGSFYLLVWLLFFQSCSAPSTLASDSDINAIKKTLTAQQEAWNNGDLGAFMTGYWQSDSLTFIGSKGIQYGWHNTLENYKKRYPDNSAMGKLQFDILKIDNISSNCVIVIGRYTLFRENDQPTGLFTILWKKIDGKWMITSDHSS